MALLLNFQADEVLAWLSARTVPANALRPGEPTGTTYGDRFRAGLTGAPALDPADPPAAFDLVITNPPFGGRIPDDVPPPPYWTYGPARRTEFDWLQYAVSRLTPGGRAAVLMPAGAAFNGGAARTVRVGLVEAGIVECVMALPAQLFELTAVKTHIWFLRAPGTPRAPERDVLFVAGEGLGHSVTRTRRALSDDDIARLVGSARPGTRRGSEGAPTRGHPD